MKCPKCKDRKLVPCFIEGLFRAHTCKWCGGHWLLIEDYVAWKERNPEHQFSAGVDFKAEETKNVMLCPMSGNIMQKYRVSHDSEHRLDYSPTVGGVWLDSGEWEYLKEKGLAGSLNKLITPRWQKAIRDNHAKLTLTKLYQEKFGAESYAKAKEIREWLNDHPCKADIRAYILANDPYSVD